MSEKTELKIASKESVALQLANDIASRESMWDKSQNYRKDFLNLYVQCYMAASGLLVEELKK